MLTAALSLGSAVALGLARFSYALLLPAMQRDLGWSFATAGTMNTANALGYLLGALAFPRLSRRWTPRALFRFGCIATATTVALSSVVANTESLLMLRVASGVGSALIFVGGGVLAARLASISHRASGLILGLYYGGTGWGIVASSILVPLAIRPIVHGWQFAWFALATACIAFSVIAIAAARRIESGYMTPGSASKSYGASGESIQWRRLGFALSGYGLFGVGYIGYMTFIVALLRNAGMSAATVSSFYILLGAATALSALLWSGLLARMRGGQALAIFNALLAFATLIPALIVHSSAVFASGVIFGATFLSAVASTTAFVRHNLPPSQWNPGISAFTIVFAFGQIVGPVIIGWVSDGSSLARGLAYSAFFLAAGAVLAAWQKPLRVRTKRDCGA